VHTVVDITRLVVQITSDLTISSASVPCRLICTTPESVVSAAAIIGAAAIPAIATTTAVFVNFMVNLSSRIVADNDIKITGQYSVFKNRSSKTNRATAKYSSQRV